MTNQEIIDANLKVAWSEYYSLKAKGSYSLATPLLKDITNILHQLAEKTERQIEN